VQAQHLNQIQKNRCFDGEKGGILLDQVQRHLTGRDWEDLISLLEFETRDLWNRIWILQEIVLALNPRIRCGNQVLPWLKLVYS